MPFVLIALVGLAVGSFLTVCVDRLPQRESIVRPRSRCPACRQPIRWSDNVPVVGYLVLGGRCASCGARIPWTYPVIEVVTAVLFVIHFAVIGWEPLLVARLTLATLLVALFFIDMEHRLLPNALTLPGLLVGLTFSTWLPPGWVAAAIGAFVGGGLLWLMGETYQRVRGEQGMGMGDVKMLAMIGAFLGWKLMIVTLVLASFAGAAAGLLLVVARRASMQYALPFGSFLTVAALVASLAGNRLLEWYLG